MNKKLLLCVSGFIALSSIGSLQAQDAKAQARIQQALAKCDQIDTRLAQVKTLKITKGSEAKARKIIANLTKSSKLCADFRAKNSDKARSASRQPAVRKVSGEASDGEVVLDAAAKKAATAKALAAAKLQPAATKSQAGICNGLKQQYATVAASPKTRQNQKILAGLKVDIARCAAQ